MVREIEQLRPTLLQHCCCTQECAGYDHAEILKQFATINNRTENTRCWAYRTHQKGGDQDLVLEDPWSERTKFQNKTRKHYILLPLTQRNVYAVVEKYRASPHRGWRDQWLPDIAVSGACKAVYLQTACPMCASVARRSHCASCTLLCSECVSCGEVSRPAANNKQQQQKQQQ